jgi:putative transposase
VKYIDDHRERFGVEPICEVLQVAPSTFYVAISRSPSTRQLGDEGLKLDTVESTSRTSTSTELRRSGGS